MDKDIKKFTDKITGKKIISIAQDPSRSRMNDGGLMLMCGDDDHDGGECQLLLDDGSYVCAWASEWGGLTWFKGLGENVTSKTDNWKDIKSLKPYIGLDGKINCDFESCPLKKNVNLLDALKLIRQTIRNSRTAPNVVDTVDWIAMKAIHDFFEVSK